MPKYIYFCDSCKKASFKDLIQKLTELTTLPREAMENFNPEPDNETEFTSNSSEQFLNPLVETFLPIGEALKFGGFLYIC